MTANALWSRLRKRLVHLRELISGEDLADAQQYRSQDLPDWLMPGGSSGKRGRRQR